MITILVKGDITIAGRNLAIEVAFKNCAPFTKCITKVDETTIDDAENLDLVMPVYNLVEYSSNYSETTERLWFILKMKQLTLIIILQTLIISNNSSKRLNY